VTKHPDTSNSQTKFLPRHRIALAATCLIALTIAWATLTPNPPKPLPDRLLSDKFYHLVAFAALVFPSAALHARSLVWILPLSALFGVTIELIQPLTGRQSEALDVVANILGLGVGSLLGLTLRAWLNRHD
jgi:VanZ family protein